MSKPEPDPREYDPAASMSLLTQLLMNPLDAGYEQYSSAGASSRLWQKALVLVVSVSLGFGTVAAVTNLRALSRLDVSDTLLDQVRSQTEVVEEQTRQNTELRAQVDAQAALQGGEDGFELPTNLVLATSSTVVTGSGLRVTLKEPTSVGVDSEARRGQYRVRDHDVRMVVNALWAGGAEAMTINGIRFGPGSFIRTAGQSILVNITPIQAPYVVEAIGDASTMSVALVQGETGDYLSSIESAHGVSIAAEAIEDVTMPALALRSLRYSTIQEDER